MSPDLDFCFSASSLSQEDLAIISNFPPLFDPHGGAKRRQIKEQEAERRRVEAEAQAAPRLLPATDIDDHPEGPGGSLQLGGEPEERHDTNMAQQNVIQPPSQLGSAHLGLGSLADDISNLNLSRGLTPREQQQHVLLQQLRSAGNPQSAGPLNSFQSSGLPQGGATSGHARNQSRFSFANDNSSSASIKPVANAKLMNQQTSMMPQQPGLFNPLSQNQSSQYFSSGVQGPPPGLKTTGTPPMSGGAMFAQGHGFANSGLGFGGNAANRQDALLREMMQGQRGAAAQASEAQKLDVNVADPSILQARLQQQQHQGTASAGGHGLFGAGGAGGQGAGQSGYNSMYAGGFGRAW